MNCIFDKEEGRGREQEGRGEGKRAGRKRGGEGGRKEEGKGGEVRGSYFLSLH